MSTHEPKPKKFISLEELASQSGERETSDSFSIGKEEDSEKKLFVPLAESREARKENRYYLPVLKINHPDMWEAKPKSERIHFTDEVATATCLGNCCGVQGLKSACCRLDPDDLEHVLGPLSEGWIKKIQRWFKKKGVNLKRQDIVIDYEEGVLIGRKFFNGHRVFENRESYPIMRIQVDGPHFSCKFLNGETGMCNIYQERPDMCRTYLCSFVKSNFLVTTKEHPNTWQMLSKPNNNKEEEDDDV